jgi:aspartyl-tRNA(Asn)/glutamyl-tRNA(Gln) amidotransferase subunit C
MTQPDERLEHLLRLARLELAPGEDEEVAADLARLLDYLERLQAADVGEEDEWRPPMPPAAATRPDVVAPSLPTEAALRLAPAARDGFFEVPRTLDDA